MENFPGFTGLRNDVGQEAFSKGDLSVATNIDIDALGGVTTRAGYVLLEAAAQEANSLWTDEERAFFVRDNKIHELFPNSDVLNYNIGPTVDAPTSFASMNGTVFAASSGQYFRITPSGVYSGIGVPAPKYFSASAIAYAGECQVVKGTYMIQATLVRTDGAESAPTVPVLLDASNDYNEIIVLLKLPEDAPPNSRYRFYLSQTNGSEMYAFDELAATTDVFSFIVLPYSKTVCVHSVRTRPIPSGITLLRTFAGRMWGVTENVLYYSDPFLPEVWRETSYFMFDKAIRTVSVVDGGLFVGTEETTYFVRGRDPASMVLETLANYGTVAGTEATVPGNMVGAKGVLGKVAFWMSSRGVCIGEGDGKMANVTGARHTPIVAASGGGVFRMNNGTPQYVVSLL